MARDDSPMFGRGETAYNGGTIDTNNLVGLNWEGMTRVFEDIDYSVIGSKASRSNRPVKCMCVRNVSGISLLPKRNVSLQIAGTDGKFLLGRVDGYTTTTAQEGYPVDEWLPAGGVVNNDLFWIVVDGPAKVLTDLASGAGSVVNVGDVVVALTAATSQATTAGRVAVQDLTGATAVLGKQLMNKIGRSLSAVTTANTNADLLVDVRKW